MRLKSLAYTSLARPDLSPSDIRAIHQTARHLNALDGVTGLLVYDGRTFLQVIEGAESAIEHLLQRLMADPRHVGLTVEDQRYIEDREFPDWAMELALVSVGYLEAQSDIVERLPASVPDIVRNKISEMATTGAGSVP